MSVNQYQFIRDGLFLNRFFGEGKRCFGALGKSMVNGRLSALGWAIMLVFIVITSERSHAQRRVDLGGFLGASYYLGDLNPSVHFKNSHPAIGGLLRYNISYRWALKGALTVGAISGYYPVNEVVLKPLNTDTYRFKRTMVDLSGMIEFNFIPFDHPFIENSNLTPYLTTGVAVTQYRRYEVDESGNNDKSVFLLSLPFGLGVKYKITDWIRVGAEWTLRKTFVDDLDLTTSQPSVDPSDPYAFHEAVKSHNNDWYSFAGVIVSFSMFDRKTSCNAGYKKF
ncbi:outer membrane protein with beta-barrel domain [Breznakibacter xylanolyticus]|uniref:Outer membrane protein with beta-barrel domain n=2 Tax=Breznakibacter xylanolyticus TaxID=990 RepID=A0A2W7NA85_9BACT|nr:outer membrane protein with beta-barrel domain [Breznakibacter xylanolyticus]